MVLSCQKGVNVTTFTNYATTDAYQQTPSKAIVSKFNAATGQRNYSTYLDDNLNISHLINTDNNIYALGFVGSRALVDSNLLNQSYQSSYGGNVDLYLGKFTKNMVPIWGTYIGGSDMEFLEPTSSFIHKNDALYFSYFSSSVIFFNTPNMSQNVQLDNANQVVMEFSDTGNLVWGTYFGGEGTETYSNISVLNDDTFYITGDTYSFQNIATIGSYQEIFSRNPNNHISVKHSNSYIAKFAPEDALSLSDVSEVRFQIFPNPVKNGTFTIVGDIKEGSILEIYTVLGQKINTQKLIGGFINKVHISDLSSGTYLLRIKDVTNSFTTKLLVN